MLEPLCKQVVSHIFLVNETDTANMQIRTLPWNLEMYNVKCLLMNT